MAPESDLQGALAAKAGGHRMETHRAVNFFVLRSVDDIKSAHPEHQNHKQEYREYREFPTDGDPGAKRAHADGKTEEPVAQPAETFPVGIRKQKQPYREREHSGERLQ